MKMKLDGKICVITGGTSGTTFPSNPLVSHGGRMD